MSQNLTQPEELDIALMEMSGMKVDALANDIRHSSKGDHELKCGESAEQTSSSYGAVHS